MAAGSPGIETGTNSVDTGADCGELDTVQEQPGQANVLFPMQS